MKNLKNPKSIVQKNKIEDDEKQKCVAIQVAKTKTIVIGDVLGI